MWLPNFPLQRFLREQPERKGQPCVLYQQTSRHGIRVLACSREALAAGIVPGIALADARSLMPLAHFEEHQPDFDLILLRTIAWNCQQFSPYVGIECFGGQSCLLLDVTGCTHLFGGDHALARQVAEFFSEQSFFPHIAIAPSVGAAWAIARYGHRAGTSRLLRSLPVEALRLPDDVLDRLRAFDLRRVEQILKLPRQELPSRFGDVLTDRIDQLFGRGQEDFVPLRPPEPIQAVWSSDSSILDQQAVRYVCADLLDEILSALRVRCEGVTRLRLQLCGETEGVTCFEQGTMHASNSTQHLLDILMLRLERERIPEGLHTIRITVVETSPLDVRQRTLFGDDKAPVDLEFHRLLDRLSTRLGPQAVVQPEIQQEPLPENSIRHRPSLQTSATEKTFPETIDTEERPASSRPLCLFAPTPIAVVSIVPDGPPVRFEWQGRTYGIARCTETEHIRTDWWAESGIVVRNYFRAETTAGERFWLFRDSCGAWFLHGVFD